MKNNELANLIKNTLANQIGVEKDDLKDEDVLSDDLHMGPSEIVDYFNELEKLGFDPTLIEKPEEQTLGDIVETFSQHMVE